MGTVTPIVQRAPLLDLDPTTLHGILKLRVDVFVVEQNCPYPEIDGRDVEPTTIHFWCADPDGAPVATARLLTDDLPDGRKVFHIGRVCVRHELRGTGLTQALMGEIVAEIGDAESVLDAQAHLEAMYARWGYVVDGPRFVENAIPHVPMRRPAQHSRSQASRAHNA
ncbi:GNAT family N-acetyltransferase [Gordonia sp. HY442]|uniref:GNAT family N-acetyltransferase n=1 Tax=Gordonia zhenghanii TaxID=2911516 RepID=UPI001F008EB9|nr:GNAT family N-acetyltransferase [Gordonia zhenghanii]MCF8605891.1 GNAT family N-acetyltransferase [Gordonia zhenghanii]